MVHLCRGFSYDIHLYPWDAYDVNLGQFGGSPFWNPPFLWGDYTYLHGVWFIHAEVSLMVFNFIDVRHDVNLGEFGGGSFWDSPILWGAHVSLHDGWFIYAKTFHMMFSSIYGRNMMSTLENLEVILFGIYLISKALMLPYMVDGSSRKRLLP